MTTAPAPKPSRRFSKMITVGSLAANLGLAGYGLATGNPDTAEVLAVTGPTSIAHALLYMGIGHLDLRAFLGQSLGGLLKGFMRGRRPKSDDDQFPPAPDSGAMY